MRASVWVSYKRLTVGTRLTNVGSENLREWWGVLDKDQGLAKGHHFNDIFDILSFSSNRQVSDERDRVYAMLGLLKGDIPKPLVPNYRKPVDELMCEATKYACLRENEAVDCMALRAVDHQSVDELQAGAPPSWVVKWASGTVFPRALRNLFRADGRDAENIPPGVHDLSKLMTSGHTLELVLSGFIFKRVTNVAPPLSPDSCLRSELLLEWIQSLRDVAVSDATQSAQGGEVNPLASTLIAGTDYWGAQATQSNASDLFCLLTYLQTHDIPDYSEVHSEDPVTATACKFYRAMCTACVQRRLFRAGPDHIGLGPALTDTGDVIAVVYGCLWPMVLRPIDDCKYRLVGICYVYGIMFGEAMLEHWGKRQPDMIFSIW